MSEPDSESKPTDPRRFWAAATPFEPASDQDGAKALEHLKVRAVSRDEAAELAEAMKEDRAQRKAPEAVRRWLQLVRSLRAAGRITNAQYVCYAGSHLEGVWDDRSFAGAYTEHLRAVQEAMEAIERREGLQRGHYWARGDEPEDYRALNDEYERIHDARLVEVMREFGESELADLFANDRSAYDALREAGRRSVFEAENLAAAIRSSVDAYEAESERAAAVSAWLAAAIMLGAAAEARLLLRCVLEPEAAARARDAISRPIRPKKSDPTAWTLEQLIHVAAEADWIATVEDDEIVVFVDRLLQQLRLTRNLSHPGRYVQDWPHVTLDDAVYLDAHAAYTALRLAMSRADQSVAEAGTS